MELAYAVLYLFLVSMAVTRLTLTRNKWQDASSPSKKLYLRATDVHSVRYDAILLPPFFTSDLLPGTKVPGFPTKLYFFLPSAFYHTTHPIPIFFLHSTSTHPCTKWQPSPIHSTLTKSRSWRCAQLIGYKRNHSTTPFIAPKAMPAINTTTAKPIVYSLFPRFCLLPG